MNDGQMPRHIPLRIYLPENCPVIQEPVNPVDENGNQLTLGDVLHQILPDLFPSSVAGENNAVAAPVIHGVIPQLEMPICAADTASSLSIFTKIFLATYFVTRPRLNCLFIGRGGIQVHNTILQSVIKMEEERRKIQKKHLNFIQNQQRKKSGKRGKFKSTKQSWELQKSTNSFQSPLKVVISDLGFCRPADYAPQPCKYMAFLSISHPRFARELPILSIAIYTALLSFPAKLFQEKNL
ncbi:hypothetical protein G9A89_013185 [Geosiphon pyriformis]|nr:hypothetical protein G9A89_013185 [Geosiphon pyriformis]